MGHKVVKFWHGQRLAACFFVIHFPALNVSGTKLIMPHNPVAEYERPV